MNYHQLYYFWVVYQEGSLTRAANRLHVTHSTISAQLRTIEQFFGQELFDRRGRRLVLTQFGLEVAQYATDIFRLGHELMDMAHGQTQSRRSVFRVGVVGSIPKTIVYRLVEPTMELDQSPALEFRQGPLEGLLRLLERNLIHVILSDQPPKNAVNLRAHTYKLGETEIGLYGTPRLAAHYRQDFPQSLAGAPLLMPSKGTNLRQSMDRWFAEHALEVRIVGEFEDAGLLRTFGIFHRGIFPVRSVLADEVEETSDAQTVGLMQGIRETYYAVSQERRITHPYVQALIEASKLRLLVPSASSSA